MLNILDSRALQRADCYGQRFMKVGNYPYNIVSAYGASISTNRPFMLRVTDGNPKSRMKQHNVPITSSAGKFSVPDPELVINIGDMVLWNCNERNAQAYAVVGEHEFFSSDRLVNESGYSHAFGSAGEYHWIDAYGSGAQGFVRVKDPGCKNNADMKRWHQFVAKGTLITINDSSVEPREVEIVTGQTVFFLVVKGPGISITDARLVSGTTDVTGQGEGATGAERKRKK